MMDLIRRCPLGEIELDLCDARRLNATKMHNRRFKMCINCAYYDDYVRLVAESSVRRTPYDVKCTDGSDFVCEHCGRTFKARGKRKYCSSDCYDNHHREYIAKRRPAMKAQREAEVEAWKKEAGCEVYCAAEIRIKLNMSSSMMCNLYREYCIRGVHYRDIGHTMYLTEEGVRIITEKWYQRMNIRKMPLNPEDVI